MLILAPRPDFTKREGSPCPKKWGSFGAPSVSADFADHSAPAAKPAVPAAKPAAARFRNCLRPDSLDSMIVSRDPEFRFELRFAQIAGLYRLSRRSFSL